MALTLIIGNKNYSSWSFRPWIAMKVAGIAFEEKVVPLFEPGSREQILQYSPAGKVPVLADGGQRIWESSLSSNISPRIIPSESFGLPIRVREHMPGLWRRKCMPAFSPCAKAVR